MKKFNEIVTTHQLKEELRKKVTGTHYLDESHDYMLFWDRDSFNIRVTLVWKSVEPIYSVELKKSSILYDAIVRSIETPIMTMEANKNLIERIGFHVEIMFVEIRKIAVYTTELGNDYRICIQPYNSRMYVWFVKGNGSCIYRMLYKGTLSCEEVLNQLLVKKSCDSAWEKIDYNEIIAMMPTRVLDAMIRGEKTTC